MAIRVLPIHTVIIDQVDFFQGDFYTRITGLTVSNLALTVFLNNVVQAWPLTSGVGLTDAQVKAGRIYVAELSVPGYYGVRFAPNAIGYWRVSLSYPVGVQQVSLDYDIVVPGPTGGTGGLHSTFVKP